MALIYSVFYTVKQKFRKNINMDILVFVYKKTSRIFENPGGLVVRKERLFNNQLPHHIKIII